MVNHLSFVDDIISFSLGKAKNLKLIRETFKYYEDIFGQMVNGNKWQFMIHPNAFDTTRDGIKRTTGFRKKKRPLTYLDAKLYG